MSLQMSVAREWFLTKSASTYSAHQTGGIVPVQSTLAWFSDSSYITLTAQ